VVEGQHVVSTRKITDSLEEQAMLEDMLEQAKPPLPDEPGFGGLHYLLSTPFRYPPLPHGSRFGARNEPSLWYGSTRVRTALAETAYYRLLFLEGTTADLPTLHVPCTAFRVPLATRHGVDLCREPFDRFHDAVASPLRFDAAQRLGAEMRAAGVQAFRYPSAREAGGVNVGVFTPAAFASPSPESARTWHAVVDRSGVEFLERDVFERSRHRFPRERFEVDGRLPAPAP
jgi:hypothetical protein